MTVLELQKRAEVYFKDGAKKMYATEDGHLFYEHDKPYADAHSRQTKSKLHELVPEEKPVKKQVQAKKDEPKKDN